MTSQSSKETHKERVPPEQIEQWVMEGDYHTALQAMGRPAFVPGERSLQEWVFVQMHKHHYQLRREQSLPPVPNQYEDVALFLRKVAVNKLSPQDHENCWGCYTNLATLHGQTVQPLVYHTSFFDASPMDLAMGLARRGDDEGLEIMLYFFPNLLPKWLLLDHLPLSVPAYQYARFVMEDGSLTDEWIDKHVRQRHNMGGSVLDWIQIYQEQQPMSPFIPKWTELSLEEEVYPIVKPSAEAEDQLETRKQVHQNGTSSSHGQQSETRQQVHQNGASNSHGQQSETRKQVHQNGTSRGEQQTEASLDEGSVEKEEGDASDDDNDDDESDDEESDNVAPVDTIPSASEEEDDCSELTFAEGAELAPTEETLSDTVDEEPTVDAELTPTEETSIDFAQRDEDRTEVSDYDEQSAVEKESASLTDEEDSQIDDDNEVAPEEDTNGAASLADEEGTQTFVVVIKADGIAGETDSGVATLSDEKDTKDLVNDEVVLKEDTNETQEESESKSTTRDEDSQAVTDVNQLLEESSVCDDETNDEPSDQIATADETAEGEVEGHKRERCDPPSSQDPPLVEDVPDSNENKSSISDEKLADFQRDLAKFVAQGQVITDDAERLTLENLQRQWNEMLTIRPDEKEIAQPSSSENESLRQRVGELEKSLKQQRQAKEPPAISSSHEAGQETTEGQHSSKEATEISDLRDKLRDVEAERSIQKTADKARIRYLEQLLREREHILSSPSSMPQGSPFTTPVKSTLSPRHSKQQSPKIPDSIASEEQVQDLVYALECSELQRAQALEDLRQERAFYVEKLRQLQTAFRKMAMYKTK